VVVVCLVCCGCADFLDVVAAGAGGFGQGMSGGRRAARECFSDANCPLDSVCAMASAGHGVCVVPSGVAGQ
jgi:DNA-binding transcriptional LysR family regulator